MRKEDYDSMFNLIGIAVCVIALIILLSSCKSKTVYVPVETIKKEKEYIDKWHRDSIYVQDSIYVEKKGDTLIQEKYRYIFMDKLVIDSVIIRDSIRVEVPYSVVEIKEVNKLKNWQIILMVLGGVFIGYLGFRLIRLF